MALIGQNLGRRWRGVPLGLLLIVIGVSVGTYAAIDLRGQRGSAQWPKVVGRMVTARVVTRGTYNNQVREAEVLYEYEVDGRTHSGRDFYFKDDTVRTDEDKEFLRTHPAGSAVDVRYDPTDPSRAVLRGGEHPAVRTGLLSGFISLEVFVGACGVMALVGLVIVLGAVFNVFTIE